MGHNLALLQQFNISKLHVRLVEELITTDECSELSGV